MTHALENDAAPQEGARPEDRDESKGLEGPGSEGSIRSSDGGGQKSPGDSTSHREGADSADSTSDEYHLRERHTPRIPTLADVELIEAELLNAFKAGSPQLAWDKAQELSSLAKEALRQAARDRFKVNFGTDVCNACDGLKAGPGVLATCFQIRQCNYSNVKGTTPRQETLITRLTKQ